ncbi:hypothetical protein [Nonomuraea sp. NPDC003201]
MAGRSAGTAQPDGVGFGGDAGSIGTVRFALGWSGAVSKGGALLERGLVERGWSRETDRISAADDSCGCKGPANGLAADGTQMVDRQTGQVVDQPANSTQELLLTQLRHTHATELINNCISIEADAMLGLTPASSASAATPPTRLPTDLSRSTPATTGQDLRDRACPHWPRLRRWSTVAATLSCCRIADDRRPGKFRSRGEAARKGRRRDEGTAIMKLTAVTQVTIDGVMQGNGGASDEDRRNGFERGGWALGAGDDETRTFITQSTLPRPRSPRRVGRTRPFSAVTSRRPSVS